MSQQTSTNPTKSNISKAGADKAITKSEQGNNWRRNNPLRYWAWTAYTNARLRAAKKKVPFSLTVDYIQSIIPDECPVFKKPFVFGAGKKRDPFTPALDRIIPIRGYVEGNVQVISFKANAIKSAYTYEDIAVVAEWMNSEGR